VCCELTHLSGMQRQCWPRDGSPITAEYCCAVDAAPPLPPGLDASRQLERLRASLGFNEQELALFMQGLPQAPDTGAGRGPKGKWGRPRCETPGTCAKEGFHQLFHAMLGAEMLPTRRQPFWWLWKDDPLTPLWMAERQENQLYGDGSMPLNHELVVNRFQTAGFVELVRQRLRGGRCLVWDDAKAVGELEALCKQVDVFVYNGGGGEDTVTQEKYGQRFSTDIHASNLPAGELDLVFCLQVFEHLRRPWKAMEELFRILKPGGQVLWAAPFFEEVHNSPGDYWRFTPQGARALAEDASFIVDFQFKPGGFGLAAGYLLGQNLAYWSPREVLKESEVMPLNVLMLLEKPA